MQNYLHAIKYVRIFALIKLHTYLTTKKNTRTMSNPTSTAATQILKTKYIRKNKGLETFTQYQLLINGGHYNPNGKTISFPKGTTLPNIKKMYPQYATAGVAVMPSETLKALQKAKCEEIAMVLVQEWGTHREEPAGVELEAATAEELAADIADPEDAIQTVKQPEAEAHYEAIDHHSEHRRNAEGDTPALSHARHELTQVKDWATFNEWMKEHSEAFALVRKLDKGRVVAFEKYNATVVTLSLDNGKEAYPFYRVLGRYFEVVPA